MGLNHRRAYTFASERTNPGLNGPRKERADDHITTIAGKMRAQDFKRIPRLKA